MSETVPRTTDTAEAVDPHAFGRYLIRATRPSDEDALRRMLQETAPADIRLRFFLHLRTFPHELVAAMLRADDRRHFAFVAEVEGLIAGSAMLVAEPGAHAAEFGIIVSRPHAGQRLGTHLMQCLFRAARAHGIGTVYGTILADNTEMTDLVRRLGFRIVRDPDDAGCVRAEMRIEPPLARA